MRSAFLGLLLAASPGILQAQCTPSAAVQTAIDELHPVCPVHLAKIRR
jgi:hypothetical protein